MLNVEKFVVRAYPRSTFASMTKPPNLFLIGAPKAGTTSLASWLSRHPDVFWSRPKEPFFFAADFPGQRNHYGLDTYEAYLKLYASEAAQQAAYRGDGSTTYLYSDVAVSSILAHTPMAQFVVALRNPLDMLPSYHRTQVVALNEDRRDFSEAWHGSLRGQGPTVSPLDPFVVDYPRIGALGAAMVKLMRLVPRSRIHTVIFDDLSRDPGLAWRVLAEGLGLDPAVVDTLPRLNASTKQARFPALRRLSHRPPKLLESSVRGLRQWSRTTNLTGVAQLKASMWSSVAPPAIASQTREEMARYYDQDIQLLSSLLSRDLTHWTGTSA